MSRPISLQVYVSAELAARVRTAAAANGLAVSKWLLSEHPSHTRERVHSAWLTRCGEAGIKRATTGAAEFLGKLFKGTIVEIVEQFVVDVDELRPRWTVGTAKLLACTLAQHIGEATRRGDAIGERHALAHS